MLFALLAAYMLLFAIICLSRGTDIMSRRTVRTVSCVIVAVLWCASTYAAWVSPGMLLPLWLEDIFVTGMFFSAISLVACLSKEASPVKTVLPIVNCLNIVIVTVIASCFLFSIIQKRNPAIPPHRKIATKMNRNAHKMFFQNLPGSAAQTDMHRQGLTLQSAFGFPDAVVLPLPEKQSGEKRIVWLGDSMVEGSGVMAGDRFTSILGSATNARQYVLAAGGLSINTERIIFRRYHGIIMPDVVFIGIFPQNDCLDMSIRTATSFGISTYISKKSGDTIIIDDHRLNRWADAVMFQPPSYLLQYLARYSGLGAYLLYLHNNAIYAAYAGKVHRIIAATPDASPIIPEIGGELRKLVSEISATGAKPAAVVIPYNREFDLDDPRPTATCAALIRSYLATSGISWFDLDAAFTRHYRGKVPPGAFVDDRVHLSADGHLTAARLLRPFYSSIINDAETKPSDQ